jgi:ankyrin repeat protein
LGDQGGRALVDALRPLADALVDEPEDADRRARREARYQPTREAITACERGDVDGLRALLDDHPRLAAAEDPGSPELLGAAVRRGRLAVVEELLRRGIDVNRPALVGSLRVAALCEARRDRRTDIEERLRRAGAVDDVYTAAFLGDPGGLDGIDEELVNEPDPASDARQATALDHAVLGLAPTEVVSHLKRLGARSPAHGHQLLRAAAEAGRADVVADLLEMGADASMVTPGRWVLHARSAALLLETGADVNHAPTRWESWIWKSCTGNRGAKDDPAYVRALVEAGADLSTKAFGKTALHFVAKAGHLESARVLLDAGADPNAPDDDGLPPLAAAERCASEAKRAAMVALLRAYGSEDS